MPSLNPPAALLFSTRQTSRMRSRGSGAQCAERVVQDRLPEAFRSKVVELA